MSNNKQSSVDTICMNENYDKKFSGEMSMDNKQYSAVDKFQNELNYLIGKGKKITSTDIRHIWMRCKIREKRNHCDTWLQSIVEMKNSKDLIESKSFTEYFNKKYKNWKYEN